MESVAVALNIKNTETEKLARELARRRGQGITEVLTEVLRREVDRERRKPRRGGTEDFHRRIQAIVDDVKKLPVLDDRTPDEIIGYNEHGHFD
jgi:antitoxin VapB